MTWQSILQTATVVMAAFTALCYAYQFVYLFIPYLFKKRACTGDKLHRYAILIAARNEEKVLPHLLESISRQDYPSELIRMFVVADNCTDNTAQAAREMGATVFVRNDTRLIGKGYALNFLLKKIEETEGLDSFDAFMIFDADNLLQPDYMRQINRVHASGYEAFCGYRNTKNFGSSWLSAGYGVWYLHDSVHMNGSRMALGASCMVNGTGFGFSREVLRKCNQWEFFTLTEDIEFSIWCVANGIKIGYCHDAILFDEQPMRFPQSWRQRTRWAQGGIQILFKRSKELFSGWAKGGWQTYSSYEFTTLSTWGYGLGIISGVLTAITITACQGLTHFLVFLPLLLVSTYLSMLTIGAWTVLTQWHRIRAKTRHKLLGVFTFPLYLLTFVPIAVCAPFCKFQWPPTAHTGAISEVDAKL